VNDSLVLVVLALVAVVLLKRKSGSPAGPWVQAGPAAAPSSSAPQPSPSAPVAPISAQASPPPPEPAPAQPALSALTAPPKFSGWNGVLTGGEPPPRTGLPAGGPASQRYCEIPVAPYQVSPNADGSCPTGLPSRPTWSSS
jgi:hypothetical protein